MKTINLKDVCGKEVLSRANARKLYDIVDDDTETVNMAGITFISRSVADELCNISDRFPSIAFCELAEDVEIMLGIVRKGRSMPRTHKSKAKVSMTINCSNMDDLRKALLSFGL